jgi:glutamyl-tRNA reductase
VGEVTVANRTVERAAELAAKVGGTAIGLDQLGHAIARSDIVVTSTGAEAPIVTRSLVEDTLLARDRPLILIDLGMPRDVEPVVRSLSNVLLYDLDDLKARCDHNRQSRKNEMVRAYELVDTAVTDFDRWCRRQAAVPTIVSLKAAAERIRAEELAEALERLPALSATERQVVAKLSEAVISRLLHQPFVALKQSTEAADSSLTSALRRLFDLEPESLP